MVPEVVMGVAYEEGTIIGVLLVSSAGKVLAASAAALFLIICGEVCRELLLGDIM